MPTPEQVHQTILDLYGTERERYLRDARYYAIWHIREYGTVTSDDIQEAVPLPSGLHKNTTGAVFHDSRLIHCGYALSRRPQAKGRVIRVWGLRQEAA